MHIIEAVNVNDALSMGLQYLLDEGVEEQSRNGKVLVAPGPVVTTYSKPWQRVLLNPVRDANPFFHLMESIWMIAGRNDIAIPAFYNSRMAAYSDDGATQWGAYGWRWRSFFGWDQIKWACDELRRDPTSRRVVVSMWNPGTVITLDNAAEDAAMAATGKDVPCNTQIYFDLRGGLLNMTVTCRSNDVLWGAYGANAVHMSFLQEVMAKELGVLMGEYRQLSNNFHLYLDVCSRTKAYKIIEAEVPASKYPATLALTGNLESITEDCKGIFEDVIELGKMSRFFQHTVFPMAAAYHRRKMHINDGRTLADNIKSPDWKLAVTEWIARRPEVKS